VVRPAAAQAEPARLERPTIGVDRAPSLDLEAALRELEVRHTDDGSFTARIVASNLMIDLSAPDGYAYLSSDPALRVGRELLVGLPEGLHFVGTIVAVRTVYASETGPLLIVEATGEAALHRRPRVGDAWVPVSPDPLVVESELGEVDPTAPGLAGRVETGVVTTATGVVPGGAFHAAGVPFDFQDAAPVHGRWTTLELRHTFSIDHGYATHFVAEPSIRR
jgi:hypothetical protein